MDNLDCWEGKMNGSWRRKSNKVTSSEVTSNEIISNKNIKNNNCKINCKSEIESRSESRNESKSESRSESESEKVSKIGRHEVVLNILDRMISMIRRVFRIVYIYKSEFYRVRCRIGEFRTLPTSTS